MNVISIAAATLADVLGGRHRTEADRAKNGGAVKFSFDDSERWSK